MPRSRPAARFFVGPQGVARWNTVERCINRVKQWRAVATGYKNSATVYLAGLYLAGIFLCSGG